MKPSRRIASIFAVCLATTHSLRADFLELKIRETTADHVWSWVFAICALIIILTLRASRSKGGSGR